MVYREHVAHLSHIDHVLEDKAVTSQLMAREHARRAMYVRLTEGLSSPASVLYNSRESARYSNRARVSLFKLIGDGRPEDEVETI